MHGGGEHGKGALNQGADLWACRDCEPWRLALAGYRRAVATRGDRLPVLDDWYSRDLPGIIAGRSPPHLTADELVRVTEWKMKRGVWRARNLALVQTNDPAAVVRASAAAIAAARDPRTAIERLGALDGVGPATASAALAAARPEDYAFFDEEVAATMPDLGPVRFTVPYYLRYLRALRERADQLAANCGTRWTADLVGRALWTRSRA